MAAVLTRASDDLVESAARPPRVSTASTGAASDASAITENLPGLNTMLRQDQRRPSVGGVSTPTQLSPVAESPAPTEADP
eukprot:10892620-Alexandrium_andersonii.AAC.1